MIRKRKHLTDHYDTFVSEKILSRFETKEGKEKKAYNATMVALAVPYIITAVLERTLWTQTDSKVTNMAIAFAKASVAYKIAGELGSGMELEILPEEMLNMPDVSGTKEAATEAWEKKSEIWDEIVKVAKSITVSDVMEAINERGKMRSFFELAGMGNGASMFLSFDKLVRPKKKKKE